MTPPRKRTDVPAYSVGEWCLGGAISAGCFWGIGILLWRALLGYDITDVDSPGLWGLLWGVLLGGIVGGLAAALLLRPTLQAVLYWGVVLGLVTPVGIGMILLAPHLWGEALPKQLSSSLGFAFGGAFAGFAGYVWSLWTARPIEPEEEDLPHPPGEATSVVPRQRRFITALRFVPVVLAAAASIGISLRIAATDPLMGLLVGVLALTTAVALWDHEQRLRKLEER
jgi:hypothetical protein